MSILTCKKFYQYHAYRITHTYICTHPFVSIVAKCTLGIRFIRHSIIKNTDVQNVLNSAGGRNVAFRIIHFCRVLAVTTRPAFSAHVAIIYLRLTFRVGAMRA